MSVSRLKGMGQRQREDQQQHSLGVGRRCAVSKCKGEVKAGMPGKFCDKHRHSFMTHGAVNVGPLDRQLRRLYIDAVMRRIDPKRVRHGKRLSRAKPLKLSELEKRSMKETLVEVEQRLSRLPAEPKRFNSLGRGSGLTNMEKAEQALSWIVKQRGLELAKKLILAHAVGAEICPKMNGSERYRITQVARAVLMLLKSELVFKDISGRKVKKHFPGRGWHFKRAVVKALELSYVIWMKEIKDAVREELKDETTVRTLELHGVTSREIQRHMKKGTHDRTHDASTSESRTVAGRLDEPRVGVPVDPDCPVCVEHGWRFACATHNTDEERAARWKP